MSDPQTQEILKELRSTDNRLRRYQRMLGKLLSSRRTLVQAAIEAGVPAETLVFRPAPDPPIIPKETLSDEEVRQRTQEYLLAHPMQVVLHRTLHQFVYGNVHRLTRRSILLHRSAMALEEQGQRVAHVREIGNPVRESYFVVASEEALDQMRQILTQLRDEGHRTYDATLIREYELPVTIALVHLLRDELNVNYWQRSIMFHHH